MDEQSVEMMSSEYIKIENGDLASAQWCQEMMFSKGITQERAQRFLKEEYALEVTLLPEPELTITITE